MANMIWVEAGPSLDDGKVAFWERHPDHPDGEVFIKAGDPKSPFEIADTPDVRSAIQEGRLALAQKPEAADDDEVRPSQANRRRAASEDEE